MERLINKVLIIMVSVICISCTETSNEMHEYGPSETKRNNANSEADMDHMIEEPIDSFNLILQRVNMDSIIDLTEFDTLYHFCVKDGGPGEYYMTRLIDEITSNYSLYENILNDINLNSGEYKFICIALVNWSDYNGCDSLKKSIGKKSKLCKCW